MYELSVSVGRRVSSKSPYLCSTELLGEIEEKSVLPDEGVIDLQSIYISGFPNTYLIVPAMNFVVQILAWRID